MFYSKHFFKEIILIHNILSFSAVIEEWCRALTVDKWWNARQNARPTSTWPRYFAAVARFAPRSSSLQNLNFVGRW